MGQDWMVPGIRAWLSTILVGCAGMLFGCSAVYPELETPLRSPPAPEELEPPPPDDVYYLYFEKVTVPSKTPGGLPWQGGLPDPFAKFLVSGAELFQTPVASKTLNPTWSKQKKANYRIAPGSQVYVEVWDSNPVTNQPICRAKVKDLKGMREGGSNEIWCDSGARVWLHVEPAKALYGIGLYYETRGTDGVRVTRVAGNSPAARAGLSAGDRILSIQGKKVADMDALTVKSLMNQHARSGLQLDVWFENGKRHLVDLQEGPIYPLAGDDLKLPE